MTSLVKYKRTRPGVYSGKALGYEVVITRHTDANEVNVLDPQACVHPFDRIFCRCCYTDSKEKAKAWAEEQIVNLELEK